MRFSLFLKEIRMVVTSITRNTSCKKEWLPFVVHVVFGTLIVASFILIMIMTVGNAYKRPDLSSRCYIKHCTVKCTKAPYYGDFEEDIINAVSEIGSVCKSIALVLIEPNFTNSIMPKQFLSRLRSNIQELAIEGGNLKYITPHAFMSSYSNNLQSLIFENVKVASWKDDTLIGLSHLKKLVIRNSTLSDIQENALQAVDDTLETLIIKSILFWDPVNITGSANLIKLRIVNFSLNIFHNALNNNTFTTIKNCQILYLNSCKITFLGPGTFDFLESLELLYLNNNYLVTIPSGLFDKVITRPIRIALHENFWFCDCSRGDLRSLYNKEILLIDLICSYPDEVSGLSLSDFEENCVSGRFLGNTNFSKALQINTCNITSEVVEINGTCNNNNDLTQTTLPQIQQESKYDCLLNTISGDILKQITNKNKINIGKSDWLTPVFSIQSTDYTLVKIALSKFYGNGLLWYQSSCEDIVYCMNIIPEIIRLYNINIDLSYTFCPYNITSGLIKTLQCVTYNLADFEQDSLIWYETTIYILLACGSLGCIACGAICVYAIIQRHPTLLKGNKRVVLVKHKTFDAIILPPEIPKRKNFEDTDETKNNGIFILSQSKCSLSPQGFKRSVSTRSSESNDASYVSALQPTDEQLFEWRCDQNVNKLILTPAIDTTNSPLSKINAVMPLDSDEKIYNTVE